MAKAVFGLVDSEARAEEIVDRLKVRSQTVRGEN